MAKHDFITNVSIDGVTIFTSTPPAYSKKYIAQPLWFYTYNAIPHEWCPKCKEFTPHVGGDCDICNVGGKSC